MYKKLLKEAYMLYIQKYGGLAYALTNKGLQVHKPLQIIFKRYYDIEKMTIVFIDGTKIEGEVTPFETYLIMKNYVIIVE